MKKVRYLTISRVALELVEKLSDQENAQFNRIIFSCFQQLENGQEMTYQETDNPFLNMALREAAAELITGYRNYCQRMNARKKAQADLADPDPDIVSLSAINQRSISDQPPTDNRREEKRIEEKRSEETISERSPEGRSLSETDTQSIQFNLDRAEIIPDSAFWTLAAKAGYLPTFNAIRKAQAEGSHNLKYVMQILSDSMRGVRA